MKRIRRCGACNAKFNTAKELIEHIEHGCVCAGDMKKATDIVIPVVEQRGVLTAGADKSKVDMLKKDGNS